jgi:hypothetical protein
MLDFEKEQTANPKRQHPYGHLYRQNDKTASAMVEKLHYSKNGRRSCAALHSAPKNPCERQWYGVSLLPATTPETQDNGHEQGPIAHPT